MYLFACVVFVVLLSIGAGGVVHGNEKKRQCLCGPRVGELGLGLADVNVAGPAPHILYIMILPLNTVPCKWPNDRFKFF